MSQEIKIRKALPCDAPELVLMAQELAAFHGDDAPVTEAALQRLVFSGKDLADVLVAESEDGGLAGYVVGYPALEFHLGSVDLEIPNFYVREKFRGSGVGRALMHGIVTLAKEAFDIGNVRLGVRSSNHAARAFYQALGFTEKERNPETLKCTLNVQQGMEP